MEKRLLSILLVLALALGLMPASAFAAEIITGEVIAQETTVVSDVELPENDELYEGYLEKMFYGNDEIALFGISAGNRLTGDEKKVYDILKPYLSKIANGERESTIVAIGQDVQYLDENGAIQEAIADEYLVFEEVYTAFDENAVIDALLLDMPYDLYWYDKVAGAAVRKLHMIEEVPTTPVYQIIFYFTPAANYAGTAAYTVDVDTEKQADVQTAVSNAKAIVAEYEGKTDYEKLLGYKEEICDLVWYEYEAGTEGGSIKYETNIDPWQLIYVFDGKTDTNVVCEGYSKAFQYLCDLSEFKDATCYTVTGYLEGGTGEGAHMWNIVRLEGKNYIADITNSDTGSAGVNGELFLKAPVSGSAKTGYSFAGANESTACFTYDNGEVLSDGSREMDMFALVGEDVLTLATEDYIPRMTTPVLGIFTDELIDGGTYPEGYPYYTNISEGLSDFEAEINIYRPDGEWYDSYSDWVDGEFSVYPIELGEIPEDAMTTGTYTITAQFLAPEDSVFENSEIAKMEFDFTHPGKSLATPSVTWDGESITVTGDDITADTWLRMELCYLKTNGVQHMSFWSQGNLAEIYELLPDELEKLKADVEEKMLTDNTFLDGKYVCRVRQFSDYIFETYHSDYSGWCELTEEEAEPNMEVEWKEDGIPKIKELSGYKDAKVIAALYNAEGRFLGGVWTEKNNAYNLSALKEVEGFSTAAAVKVFACDSGFAPIFAASARP